MMGARRRLTFLLWAAAALLLPAAAAGASTLTVYGQGAAGHPFTLASAPRSVQVLGAGDQRLELRPRILLGALDKTSPVFRQLAPGLDADVRTAVPLSDGHLLISSGRYGGFVAEVDAAGKVLWSYVNGVDGYLKHPFSAQPATFGGRRCVLISDRWTYRVFAVTMDTAKRIEWQYGTTDVAGAGVNQLADPFTAVQLPRRSSETNGDVLIADSLDNHRAIEVRADDYDPSAPNDGYTAGSIVWQYGTTGVYGDGVDQLKQVRSPQRLANGDTLIADAEGQRAIEVRTSDYDPSKPNAGYTAASIVWQYGTGAKGPLSDPNTATRIESGPLKGLTVITDTGDDRILWVDASGTVVDEFDTQSFDRPIDADPSDGSDPRGALYAGDGSLWIPDPGYKRAIRVGNAGSGTVTTAPIDCGQPGARKAFVRLTLKGTSSSVTSFSVHYRIDAGAWRSCGPLSGGRVFTFPGGATGKAIALQLTLASKDRRLTPALEGFSVEFAKPAVSGARSGGGGSTTGAGANSGGASGTFAYPTLGGTGGSGSGTGSGGGGYGTGSGASGTGSGSGGSTSSAPSGTTLSPPVQSSGSGASESVSGTQVQGQEGVSGVPLRAAPGAQEPAPQTPGPPLPVGVITVAGLVTLAACLVPWPLMAARLRRIGGFDHTRPKRYAPFWPLGR